MRGWLLGTLLLVSSTLSFGCGLLASAAQNPSVQAMAIEAITAAIREVVGDELEVEDVPVEVLYENSPSHCEHNWLVTVPYAGIGQSCNTPGEGAPGTGPGPAPAEGPGG